MAETDLRRAIGAAKKAGLRFYSVEVAPDGTIAIVVGPHRPTRRSSSCTSERAGRTSTSLPFGREGWWTH